MSSSSSIYQVRYFPSQHHFLTACGDIAGVQCKLFYPKKNENGELSGTLFNYSVWDKQRALVSGFFSVFRRRPTYFTWTCDSYTAVEKIDGQTYVLDNINGDINVRTRDSLVECQSEVIDFIKLKYPNIISYLQKEGKDESLIFEYVHPNYKNKVLYKDQELYLTGIINKKSCRLLTQDNINTIAKFHHFTRPDNFPIYKKDMEGFLEDIPKLINKEGYVLFNNGYTTGLSTNAYVIDTNWYKKQVLNDTPSSRFLSVLDVFLMSDNLKVSEEGLYYSYSKDKGKMAAEMARQEIKQVKDLSYKVLSLIKDIDNFIDKECSPLIMSFNGGKGVYSASDVEELCRRRIKETFPKYERGIVSFLNFGSYPRETLREMFLQFLEEKK